MKHDVEHIQHKKIVLFVTAINLHTPALLAALKHFPPHARHNDQQ
jgi:hypothetical protein